MAQTVLITGASRGIGRAAALRFIKEGWNVAAQYRTGEEEARRLEHQARQLGGNLLAFPADVADRQQVQQLVDEAQRAFGRIDALVNNAGISQSTKIENYDPADFSKIIDLNIKAIFHAIQPAVAIMREQGGGVILSTSSMVSISGQPSGVGYPASKFAVNGLTLSLARELGPSNIRVNAVAPGVTRTDMVAALPDAMIQPLIATIPLRRIGEPEDIANAFLFLASDMASYVTGEILSVDGAARA